MSKKPQTPLMQQYWEIKSAHPDKILFFRMGDFYELFFEDAILAAPILEIVLTSRNKKSEDETPMCGMPHHSVAGPINKLLARGYKVAICDQIEDPKFAKGIVKRAITRILSPGVVYDPDNLEGSVSQFLVSLEDEVVSFLEPTTGESFYYKVPSVQQWTLLQSLNPKEVVLHPSQKSEELEARCKSLNLHITYFEETSQSPLPKSAQRLIDYVAYMQGKEILETLSPFEERTLQSRMILGSTVLRHLEVFESYRGEKEGTFFHAIDRTQTPSGRRLFKRWMLFPLTDKKQIEDRQDRVGYWVSQVDALKRVRQILSQMGDIERRVGKLSHPQCLPRDLLALSQSLHTGLMASHLLGHEYPELHALVQEMAHTLVEEPPLSKKQGGIIKRGVNTKLDEYIELSTNSHDQVLSFEQREKERTGISSLKVRYNNVFGYYIEITHTHAAKVPSDYQRKQTLVNAERFTTPELSELEKKVLSAQALREKLEEEIFEQLRAKLIQNIGVFLEMAHEWSELDVVTGMSWLAVERRYVRPTVGESSELHLTHSKHPLLEQTLLRQFVPNSLHLAEGGCLLLTGPNMAGKSTLMRQVALIAILAQVGAYVPAEKAMLPIFDRIFTRIGASDSLNEGLSTFMVEMKEAAEMLRSATSQSLIILDEIGRGTATYDGMSLAQAILEHLVTQTKSYVLFATHYHELTELSGLYPQIQNGHMTVKEEKGEIRFLHTLVNGATHKSYGVQVARLAGLPSAVIERSEKLLREKLEHKGTVQQMSLFAIQDHTV